MPRTVIVRGILKPFSIMYPINLINKVNNYNEYPEADLINLALKIDNQNDLLNTVKTALDFIAKTGNLEHINTVRSLIARNIELNNSLDDVELIMGNFRNKLNTSFPQLSAGDIKLAGLIRLNYTTKQIADLLRIQVRSVEQKRHRLRQKMKLNKDQKLSKILVL